MTFEKRGAMPDRKSLACALWLTSLIALLASALFAPIRMSEFVSGSSRFDGLTRNFTLPPDQPTILVSARMATDTRTSRSVKPLFFERSARFIWTVGSG